jgi:hypothetical protein
VTLALNESCEGEKLQVALKTELIRRDLDDVTEFLIPAIWETAYPKIAKSASLPSIYQNFGAACKLTRALLNPAFTESVSDKKWDPKSTSWMSGR